jgi:hypothetical protein
MLPNRFNFSDSERKPPRPTPVWLTRYVLWGFIVFIVATLQITENWHWHWF